MDERLREQPWDGRVLRSADPLGLDSAEQAVGLRRATASCCRPRSAACRS